MIIEGKYIKRFLSYNQQLLLALQKVINSSFAFDEYEQFYYQYKEIVNFIEKLSICDNSKVEYFKNLPKLPKPGSMFIRFNLVYNLIFMMLNPYIAGIFIAILGPILIPYYVVRYFMVLSLKKKLALIQDKIAKINETLLFNSHQIIYNE